MICQYVADTEGSVPLEELATHVLTEERADSEQSLAEVGPHRQIAIELHHYHLPRLAESTVLQYDSNQHLIRSGAELPTAVELIETIE